MSTISKEPEDFSPVCRRRETLFPEESENNLLREAVLNLKYRFLTAILSENNSIQFHGAELCRPEAENFF